MIRKMAKDGGAGAAPKIQRFGRSYSVKRKM